MGTRSFFIPRGSIDGGRAELPEPVARQIRSVLRLRPGDTVELLDNSGFLFVARLTEVSRDVVSAEVVERRRPSTEPAIELQLFQALLKGEKMELVLQKGTEIGVSRFVPVLSERCISRPSAADLERRRGRWETVVREAAEQSGRALLPVIAPLVFFEEACRAAAEAGVAVIAWEEEVARGIGAALRDAGTVGRGGQVALMVGPEGGFSEREVATARDAGLRVVSLGPRILRAETAAIVGSTLLLCHLGELGG